MRINPSTAYAPSVPLPQVASRGTAATQAAGGSAAATTPSPESASVERADFSSMTRKDLLDWMNTQIKSGELTLDDTSGLLNMTMKVPVNGALAPLDDQERVNFMQLARDGISWGKQKHDAAQVQSLQTALSIMQQHQGEPVRVNLTA